MDSEKIAQYSRVLWDREYASVAALLAAVYDAQSIFDRPEHSVVVDSAVRAVLAYTRRVAPALNPSALGVIPLTLASTSTALGRGDLAKLLLGDMLAEQANHSCYNQTLLAQIHGRKGSAHFVDSEYEDGAFHQRRAYELLAAENEPLLSALAANNLGLNLIALHRLDEAERHLSSALTTRMEKLGPAHLDTIATRMNIATIYASRRASAEGIYCILACIRDLRRSKQTVSIEYANCCSLLSRWFFQRGNLHKVRFYIARNLNVLQKLGAGHAVGATMLRNISTALTIIAAPLDYPPSTVEAAHEILQAWGGDREL